MPQRSNNFTINRNHSLAKGLVFAGLGAHAGSTRYHDSSAYGNTGTLTNMDPPTDWVWDSTLNRFVTVFNAAATNQNITLPDFVCGGTTPIAMAAWTWNLGTTNNWAISQATEVLLRVVTAKVSFVLNSFTTNDRAEFGTVQANMWQHIAGVYNGTTIEVFLNGASVGSVTPTGTYANASAIFTIGNGFSYWFDGSIGDPCIWIGSVPTPAGIKQLADPSNAMLSGLIQPPRRKWWPVVSGAAPTFKAAWATKRRQTIGGGVI